MVYFPVWSLCLLLQREDFIFVETKMFLSYSLYSSICTYCMRGGHVRQDIDGVTRHDKRERCFACLTWTRLLLNTSCAIGKITLLLVHVYSGSASQFDIFTLPLLIHIHSPAAVYRSANCSKVFKTMTKKHHSWWQRVTKVMKFQTLVALIFPLYWRHFFTELKCTFQYISKEPQHWHFCQDNS